MSFDVKEKSQFGARPVELFRFTQGSSAWLYTSASTPKGVAGLGYFTVPEGRIVCGEVAHTSERGSGTLEVTVHRANPVAALFLTTLPIQPPRLTKWLTHDDELTNAVVEWTGRVAQADFDGPECKLTCIGRTQELEDAAPAAPAQATCGHVFGSAGCGVKLADFTVTATLSAVGSLTVTSSTFGARADGWYTGGKLIPPSGAPFLIVAHTGNVLTLLGPPHGLAVGSVVRAVAGCDRTYPTCVNKFNNGLNFLGLPFWPEKNPFVERVW